MNTRVRHVEPDGCYEPEDDSEITFRAGINEILNDSGRVGPMDA